MDISASDLLKQVQASLDKASSEFSKNAENALKEAKSAGELSQETKNAVDKIASEFNALNTAHEELKAALGEVEQVVASGATGGKGEKAPSVGEIVARHEALQAFASGVSAGRRISVPVPQAALITGDLDEGIIAPQRLPGVQTLPQQRLFIRDLIAPGRTESNAIFWIQQTGFTNNAAVVAENTKKPESEIEFEPKITPVTTIAHLFKASKQILDDFSQLRSLVDAEMRFGLKFKEEQEILFGDGTGVHLHGIVPQASAFDPAFEPELHSAIDDLRLAMLQAQLARIPATGHVLHFTDWARIELLKDTLGRYIIGNPQGTTSPTLWNLPVVTTEASAMLGKFLTGAFAYGAQIFDREDANVVVSTENVDDFEKNMITIRAEERLALAVYRPEAFVFGNLSVVAPASSVPASS